MSDKDGYEPGEHYREALRSREQAYQGDLAYADAYEGRGQLDYEEQPEWTFDEERQLWVDRDGNPYVQAYAEGEEDRYAPAEEGDLAASADMRFSPERRSRSGALSLAALVIVGCLGGGLAYAWKKGAFIGSDLPGLGQAPPVIKASSDPVKIKPAETQAAADQPTRAIFDRGSQQVPASSERVVAHEEQPVAVVPVRGESAPATAPQPAASPLPANPAVSTETGRQVATSNIVLPSSANLQTASSEPAGLPAGDDAPDAPRRVKTIKILPDSSVVTGDAPITGSDNQASSSANGAADAVAARSDAPAQGQPVSTQQSQPDFAPDAQPGLPVISANDSDNAVNSDAEASRQTDPQTAASSSNDNASTTVVAPTQTVKAAKPPARPRIVAAQQQTAPAQQMASAEAVSAPVADGAYVVQVSSQRSEADAQNAFASLQRRYPSVFAGMKPSVKRVELGERGVYYRVRVGGWSSSSEASSFCAKLKAAGGDCVITRG